MLIAALFATNLGTTRKLVLRLVVAAYVTAEITTLETALSKNKTLSISLDQVMRRVVRWQLRSVDHDGKKTANASAEVRIRSFKSILTPIQNIKRLETQTR